eukprot:scaffold4934_cov69-Skeletonema_marinoi.AAC.4
MEARRSKIKPRQDQALKHTTGDQVHDSLSCPASHQHHHHHIPALAFSSRHQMNRIFGGCVLRCMLSVIMADGGDNVFVYLGGEQEVPRNVTHDVIIDRSVKIFQRGHSINVF